MHKATFERVYGKPYVMDERDESLLRERIIEWDKHQGPRVGDFLDTPDGSLRLTHDWGDTIQTTVPRNHPCAGDVSFYLTRDGYMSFSGSLNPGIDKALLQPTNETRMGSCWFFSHDYAEAHNGVRVMVPCRVYKLAQSV